MLASSGFLIALALVAGIGLIIFLSTRYRVHPFFSLSLACFLTGILGGMDVAAVLSSMKEGFGKIMSSLGYIIIVGTALGMVLQASGATTAMANAIIKWVGERRSVLAMSLTGFVVGLPIFCDSGYIVLNGLSKSMVRKTGVSVVVMSTVVATALYSVHCLVPPHPGITAATGNMQADLGKTILWGSLVAIPAMLTGYIWALMRGRKLAGCLPVETIELEEESKKYLPPASRAFIPVIVPILLIAVRAILQSLYPDTAAAMAHWLIIGDPALALTIGLGLALCIPIQWQQHELRQIIQKGMEKAGDILIIIGAGGAFGAIISGLSIQSYLANAEGLKVLGLLFPFIVAMILKTAQGSSTVAVITAASIVYPFLHGLQLDSENGRVLAVLAMGAGSMAASHVNDSYFWVITNFSGQQLKPMLHVFTVATLLMGMASMLCIYLLSLLIL